ncbi:MAG: rhomboid family intramembrane serine protease [Anaerolineae bacterium]|nr:rhomboid family intramembrane serine protease [Anaerolineae bacterium]MCB0180298.1 rhomboid family intramembrane serine protease [Anaerolineae bacterium]MCB0222987.1 rhomboid family intramembrane serine protease [Anaerolineae bacterium]MCB9109529.1 rhomboid family intramembrane serine protease [Anaerolineales bacterium]
MIADFQALFGSIVQTALDMGLLVIALWIIHLIDTVLGGGLKKQFGLRPRTTLNPLAFFISPFLHVDFKHLMANTIPFFILGTLVMIQGQLVFWITTLIIIIAAGLGIWLFGRPGTLHVGASGLILGYFGYLLANVFFNPNLATIVVAVVVAVLYLGLIWQVVPLKKGVSTMGHLFGFLGGIAAAWITALL